MFWHNGLCYVLRGLANQGHHGTLPFNIHNKDEAWTAGRSGALLLSLDDGNTWRRDKAADSIVARVYSHPHLYLKYKNNCQCYGEFANLGEGEVSHWHVAKFAIAYTD